jgi:uncharacterized damage-inducible protein DinB
MKTAVELSNTPEFAVAFTTFMLDSMEREMEVTHKVLAAVPEAQREFRPDPKSRTAFELAWHLAEGDVDFLESIANRRFSLDAPRPGAPKPMGELLAWYDVHFQAALKRVRTMTAEELMTPVDFYGVMTAPVFRFLLFANNHSIHHRAQLATYLRPMGSKVPSIYGGSADEPWKG